VQVASTEPASAEKKDYAAESATVTVVVATWPDFAGIDSLLSAL